MRILLYGGASVTDEAKVAKVGLWARVMRLLNPECDMLLLDTASSIRPETFLEPGILIKRFEDNPGHLSRGGGDGAGRTFFAGLQHAIDAGYDYAVTCETDFLFARPVMDVCARMAGAGVKVGCLQMRMYQFFEWGFAAMTVAWARETNIAAKYDWRSPRARTGTIPEIRMEWACGSDLFILPYRGMRTSEAHITPENLSAFFPYGPPDWIHDHNNDTLDVMHAFLRLNGIAA